MVANIGLGPARTFATNPVVSAAHANAPMGLRAIANLLDDKEFIRTLPNPSRYQSFRRSRGHPYERRRRNAKRLLTASRMSFGSTVSSSGSIRSSVNGPVSIESVDAHRLPFVSSIEHSIGELNHYLPLPVRLADSSSTLPPLPEHLVTLGFTTVLSVALSPSLEALLAPATENTWAEAEIGISILARLTRGILPMHEAFSSYGSTRLIPLLVKLQGLGVIDTADINTASTHLDAVFDADGRLDILNIVFDGRSEADVRALLGETLTASQDAERQWFAICERKTTDAIADAMTLSTAETEAMTEQWERVASAPPPPRPIQAQSHTEAWDGPPGDDALDDTSGLIFPTIDVAQAGVPILRQQTYPTDMTHSDEDDVELALTPPEPYSWPSTAETSPSHSRHDSAYSNQLIDSLFSQAALKTSDIASRDEWSVSPRDEDSDLESSISPAEMGSDIWSDAESGEAEMLAQSPTSVGSWAGSE